MLWMVISKSRGPFDRSGGSDSDGDLEIAV